MGYKKFAIAAIFLFFIVLSGFVYANNDYCEEAWFFYVGPEERRHGWIDPEGDKDWYKFYVHGKGKIKVRLDGPDDPNVDLDLYVYKNCEGDLLCYSNDFHDSDEECSFFHDTQDLEFRYIEIYGYQGTGEYYLYVDLEYCNSGQCTSPYWRQCYGQNEKCCEGDNLDGDPETRFGQWICISPGQKNEWGECTKPNHQQCEQTVNLNHCTQRSEYVENDGGNDYFNIWKWRFCGNGCDGPDCHPNILIRGIETYPYNVEAGDTVNFDVEVKNAGGEGYADIGFEILDLYDNPLCRLHWKDNRHFDPDQTRYFSFNYTVPEGAEERSYDVRSNTWDNCYGNCGPDQCCDEDTYCQGMHSQRYDYDAFRVSCTDECSYEGQTRCYNSNYEETCGYYDQDSCLEWGGRDYCEYGCTNGECQSGGHGECESDNDCDPDGCYGNYFCVGNERRCDNYKDYYCYNDGQPDSECRFYTYNDYLIETCDKGCVDGQCVECDEASDCGTDYEEFYCQDGDVWKREGYYTCENYQCVLNENEYRFEECEYYCEEGQCVEFNQDPVHLSINDADYGVKVNRQPGEQFTLHIYSPRDQPIYLNFNENVFFVVSGNCVKGFMDVSAGDNECVFEVNEESSGNFSFVSGDARVKVGVPTKPNLLIVTNTQKLVERYENEGNAESKVRTLMKLAYKKAETHNGVVYDLSKEGGLIEHPFSYFSQYYQVPSYLDTGPNDYVLQVSEKIKKWCNGCKNILIIGDDFVIPHFRLDYADIEFDWWRFENVSEISHFLTDQPYIKKTFVPVANLGKILHNEPIIIVKPEWLNVDGLKNAINQYYSPIRIAEKNEADIGCNSKGELGNDTLILIGNRENNNAVKCIPWFGRTTEEDTFEASISLERNVWGTSRYAIIINGNNLDKAVQRFIEILGDWDNNPKLEEDWMENTNELFVYDLDTSQLPEDPNALLKGIFLGRCEQFEETPEMYGSCATGDFVIALIPLVGAYSDVRDMKLFCPILREDEGGTYYFLDDVTCFAATAGIALEFTVAEDIVGDVFKKAVKEMGSLLRFMYKGMGKGIKKTMTHLSFLRAFALGSDEFKTFFKLSEDLTPDNPKYWTDATKAMSDFKKVFYDHKNSQAYAEIFETFDDPEITAQILKNTDHSKEAIRGARKILEESGLDLRQFIPGGDTYSKLLTVKAVGKNILKATDQALANKTSKYIKKAKDFGYGNVVDGANDVKHTLKRTMNAPDDVVTKIGDTEIEGFVVLKEGVYAGTPTGWGWKHIKHGNHHNDIKIALGLSNNEDAVREVIEEVIESGTYRVEGDSFVFIKNVKRGNKAKDIRVVVSNRAGREGSIITAYPFS